MLTRPYHYVHTNFYFQPPPPPSGITTFSRLTSVDFWETRWFLSANPTSSQTHATTMAHVSLPTYLYLKFFVLLLRLASKFQVGPRIHRDRLLAQQRYPTVQRTRIKIPSRDQGRFIVADLYLPPSPPFPPDCPPSTTTIKTTTAAVAAAAAKSSPKKQDALPVLVNYHGSGFVLDFLGTNVLACTQLASELGIAVLDADYRKAPEYPFPAALHDIEDLLHWLEGGSSSCSSSSVRVVSNHHLGGNVLVSLDPSCVLLSGYSAGANLALVAASSTLRRRQQQQQQHKSQQQQYLVDKHDKDKHKKGSMTQDDVDDDNGNCNDNDGDGDGSGSGVNIRGILAIYPLLDLSAPPATRDTKGRWWSLASLLLTLFLNSYIPSPQDRRHSSILLLPAAAAAAAAAPLPHQLPDTVVGIVTCEQDILAIEGQALVKTLEERAFTAAEGNGNAKRMPTTITKSIHLDGVSHAFDSGAKVGTLAWERREEMHAMMVATLRLALER